MICLLSFLPPLFSSPFFYAFWNVCVPKIGCCFCCYCFIKCKFSLNIRLLFVFFFFSKFCILFIFNIQISFVFVNLLFVCDFVLCYCCFVDVCNPFILKFKYKYYCWVVFVAETTDSVVGQLKCGFCMCVQNCLLQQFSKWFATQLLYLFCVEFFFLSD